MTGSSSTFFQFKTSDTQKWDSFVMNNPQGSIHQITAWKDFQQTIPGREKVLGFGLKDKNENIIASSWCVQMHTGFAQKFWFYSARGPVMSNQDPQLKAQFIEQIKEALKTEGGVFWRLDPYWQEADWKEIKTHGTALKPATKNFQPTDSLILDLRLSEEEIRSQMKRTGRRNLKLAEKSDLKIRKISAKELTKKDIDTFYNLNQETTARDKFHGHEASYYQNFIKHLSPHAYLYLVEFEQTPVAAAITTFCGPKAIYYFGASTSASEYRDLRAPYLLQWAMIKDAQTQGCQTYDFTGITPENEPEHAYKGITQFKTRFGGYRSTFAAGKEIVLNPYWYKLYQLAKIIRP